MATIQNVTSVPGGYVIRRVIPDPNNPAFGASTTVEDFIPAEDVISSSQNFRNFGLQTDIQLPDDYVVGATYTPPVIGQSLNQPAKVTNINTGESAPIDRASEVINKGGDAPVNDKDLARDANTTTTAPTTDMDAEKFDKLTDAEQDDYMAQVLGYDDYADMQSVIPDTPTTTPTPVTPFNRDTLKERLGIPTLSFADFNKAPVTTGPTATAGIERLRPTDTTGTMAGVFASPQFTSPYSVQTEQQQLPDTFTQLGDLFSEQFKEEIRGPLEEQIRAEVAEEAAGNRAGGLASLGYRRGGVVDENGIPRLFIGGLFKGIGRALSGAVKGITKIAPFVLPFIPGFQALTPFKQALVAGGIGGFRDGKFDPTRALTAGVTTYGLGKLAEAAGASGQVSEGMGGVDASVAEPMVRTTPGTTTSFPETPLPDVKTGAYRPNISSGMENIAQGSVTVPTETASYVDVFRTPATTSSGVGLDSLKGQVVGTGQNILRTGEELISGNIPMKKLITPAISTLGGITATKAGDEIAKQEAEYKALTAADAAEKERKRRLALEAMRRNPFGYNKGGETSLPPRYLDGAGDGMSDSIRANIGGMQEARLADGEFVVPADVVADLGNGSSNAGAERLYSMMDRIRQARHGTTKQPPEVNVNKTLPA
jgi:hypothetical protein